MKVALLDYGVGNLHSLRKGLEGAGAEVVVTTDWRRALDAAGAMVLPGVGAFSAAMEALPSDPSPLRQALLGGLPCLGICLGMQLLMDRSEEGEGRGIGVISGSVQRLEAKRVPQMGWNEVETAGDPLFQGVEAMPAYYANSYVCRPDDSSTVIAWSTYEGRRLVASVRSGNTWGVQFHPEKSSGPGRRLLANFLALAASAGKGGVR